MEQFYKKVTATWGDAGKAWLETLPALVETVSESWELYKLKPHTHLSYNYVLTGYSGAYTEPVILKIGFDKTAIQTEAAALISYQGNGCVKLLEHDFDNGALLIEAAVPGMMLKTLFPHEDEAAIVRVTQVIKQLHAQPIEHPEQFPTIQDWLSVLHKQTTNAELEKHRARAIGLCDNLLATQQTPVLLHGDLHHENLLSSHRHGWLAIDPKGVLGEPAYECGAYIRNPIEQLIKEENPTALLKRRIELFATHMNVDYQRIKDWSYVQAVLAACWSNNEQKNQSQWMKVVDYIESIK